jgi:(2S)-methylsuccinyl-CoA dehydrogenase
VDVSLDQARTLVEAARAVVDAASARLSADSAKDGRLDLGLMDREQILAYDLSSIASQVTAAEEMLAYGEQGELERLLTVGFAGEVVADLGGRIQGRASTWALDQANPLDDDKVQDALRVARSPELREAIAERVLANPELPRHLGDEMDMVRDTFRDFAEEKVKPVAERVHRHDEDIPDQIIEELAAMGCFGLSIPEDFGGYASPTNAGHSENDFMSMVVVTEELSRGSLGVAGSLITRPEILSKALVKGGTDEQKQRWLPKIATGELMCGVAVTEPDFGSDVASLKVTATKDGDFYVVNGVKTWCTFAGRANLLMLLARTGKPEDKHKGLSLFVVEKPSYPGHEWTHEGEHGGRMEARAIGTIGYRGMHSFEISFEDYRVPAENLVGGEDYLGKGFYLQMDAFANGRLQTAARALGVMQAAFDDAVAYANDRHVFGVALADYQLTQSKLARMAMLIAACRRFSYRSAQLLGTGEGQLEASMVKAFACLAAEWVSREAQQLHGGYGYAEEYAVSRYFVDARVLSIFEGADEVLALRVIIRRLLEDQLAD